MRNKNTGSIVEWKYVYWNNWKKYKFDCIVFNNRWKFNKSIRNCNWTIFGLRKEWFDPNSYSYTIAIFGLDCSIWFKRKLLSNS